MVVVLRSGLGPGLSPHPRRARLARFSAHGDVGTYVVDQSGHGWHTADDDTGVDFRDTEDEYRGEVPSDVTCMEEQYTVVRSKGGRCAGPACKVSMLVDCRIALDLQHTGEEDGRNSKLLSKRHLKLCNGR